MSEEDYQRGRRGGDFRVGCDWDDWKAGRDDLERESREAERAWEQQVDAEIAASQRQIVELSNRDLGEYTCPHCLQRSLRLGARVCPLCQRDADIDWRTIREHIKQVNVAKQAAAAAAAAEWERARPARERQAEERRLRAERSREDALRADTKKRRVDSAYEFLMLAIGLPLMYFLPLFSAWSTGSAGRYLWVMFIPGLNWLIWLGLVLFGHVELVSHALLWLGGGVVFGVGAYAIVKQIA